MQIFQKRTNFAHAQRKSLSGSTSKFGKVILVSGNHISRGLLLLAKIVAVNKSKDNEIRSARIKTRSGKILSSPVYMLFNLEVTNFEPSEDSQAYNVEATMAQRKAATTAKP